MESLIFNLHRMRMLTWMVILIVNSHPYHDIKQQYSFIFQALYLTTAVLWSIQNSKSYTFVHPERTSEGKFYTEKGPVSKQIQEDYINLLAPIEVQVLAEKSKTEKKLQAWEKEYYIKNNLNSPSYEMMKQHKEASVLLKKIKYANALLKKWDIFF